MRFLLALVALVAFQLKFALADSRDGLITNPQPGLVWTVGETQTVIWHTTYTSYTVTIWQQEPQRQSAHLGPIVFEKLESDSTYTQFDWVVQTYHFNLTHSDTFFFWIFEGVTGQQASGNTTSSISGSYFTIKAASVVAPSSPSSSGISTSASSTSTPTSGIAAASGNTSTSDQQIISNPPSNEDSRLSSGAKAGIGIAVSVVGVAAFAALFFWARHLKKRKQMVGTRLRDEPPPTATASMGNRHEMHNISMARHKMLIRPIPSLHTTYYFRYLTSHKSDRLSRPTSNANSLDAASQGNRTLPNRSSAFFTINATSTTSSSTSTSTSSTSTSISARSDNPKPTNSGGGSLSTGAQAGIGVSAAVVGIALNAALFLYIRQLKRKKQLLEDRLSSQQQQSGGLYYQPPLKLPQEMDSTSAIRRIHEAPSGDGGYAPLHVKGPVELGS
ncbi:hypothetical protein B0T17DRAFT_622010 [Bombardia bombarda]|uniref:Mid2 domain-containing protein n=1 Tax=Bombardia bombarda TaxID=252184 RepID=A0AA40CEF8_9PEZI|nr:hypothetical protein B0T17DRAFT_622010 [Bombardia bombarda]